MTVDVKDVRLIANYRGRQPDGTITSMCTEMERVWPVHSIPSTERISWSLDLSAAARSSVTFTADVETPLGNVVSQSFAREVGGGDTELSLEPNPVTFRTAGTYTFRLFVDGQLKWSDTVSVIVGP